MYGYPAVFSNARNKDHMPCILRILNRLAVGGQVLNASCITKYMIPELETLLVVGEKDDHEKSASFLADDLGIEYTTVAGMGRSINPASDFLAYQKMKNLIKDFKPDIVHTHAAKPGAIGCMAAAVHEGACHRAYFSWPCFSLVFQFHQKQFFYQRPNGTLPAGGIQLCPSASNRKKSLSIDFKIAPPEKFRVIPLGFDLDHFQTDQEQKREKFRTEFALADDEVAIGITGRLYP